jgi:N-acetylmuramoyl-L-alanine amidase
MRNQSSPNNPAPTIIPHLLVLVVFCSAIAALIHGLWGMIQLPASEPFPPLTTANPTPPTSSAPVSTSAPTATPAAGPLPIGIVAGHWGNDPGAVCDGGLREVDINLAVAQQVADTLGALGYPVDLLEEFDARLEGYQARALISIHSDACLYPEASGFKVARVEDSLVPAKEDQLLNCLKRHYQERSGLAFHEGSITPNMTHYHVFYAVAPETPGVIIELGFMLADRDILVNHQDWLAQGIVEGVLCFLNGETP